MKIKVNRKKVQWMCRLKGWQCKQRWKVLGRRSAEGGKVEVNDIDEGLSIDLTRIYCGEDDWRSFIGVLDCCSAELVGYRFALRGRAVQAVDALDIAIAPLVARLRQ